ncbi:MAG TPA: hypothetical protein VHM27_12455 [Rhizomicrobium sp.]|jgi:hypothetical protein|nr:hypothetical protein [Rhizomicrobium sp.]
MHTYEIRVLDNGRTRAVLEAMHLNDNAAVRAGKKLADGKPFEVWRELDCIYGCAAPRDALEIPAA